MGQVITSGNTSTVSSGATLTQTDVQSGAYLDVLYGGTANQTTIEGGGQVYDAGTVSGASGVNAFLDVQSGGTAYDVFSSRGLLIVESGGLLSGATLSGTIDTNDDGGFLAAQYVNGGATAIGTLLDQGGLEFVGGNAINTTGSGRSNDIVDTGVLTYSGINAQVSASVGGNGVIDITGASTRVAISDVDEPAFYGTFTGAAVIGANTELELQQTDALGSGTILFSYAGGGTLVLDGNASPTETIGDFYSGNSIVITGGVDSAAQVSDNLVQLFYANGTEDDITILGVSDPLLGIFTENGETILSSYSAPTIIDSDPNVTDSESNYLILPGGLVEVTSGGFLSDSSVGNDDGTSGDGTSANLTVQFSGSVANILVTSDGVEDVQSGGTSTDDTFFEGGQQIVENGGTSYDPMFNGGTLIDNGAVSHGMLSGSPTSGTLFILSGSGSVTQAGSGSLAVTGDASSFAGSFILSGGTLELGSNTNLGSSASIDFAAPPTVNPTLLIDASLNNLPQATISGFTTSADIFDLRGLSFSANSASTPFSAYDQAFITSGGSILEVISGGTSGTLNLDSSTTGPGPLNLSSDNNGGTNISFSVLSAGNVSALDGQLDQASTLSNGTYTVFLTSALTVTSDAGGTAHLDPLIAQNGATVVLNGEGFAITPGDGGDTVLSATSGPLVVTSLGGGIGLDVGGGAHLTVTSNTFGGGILLMSGVLEVADSAGGGTGGISFDPTSGGHQLLQIDNAALPADGGGFTNVINEFASMSGQYIDLAGFTFSSATTSATLSPDGSTLSVTNGGETVNFDLVDTAYGALNTFTDANGGTIVTADAVACYATGTRILTETGERPVETLAVGDCVVTAAGAVRPIRWIGHRSYRGRFLAARRDHMPVCIAAGALADGVPMRDLFVSPKHAMFIDGLLVPAAALVNGASITQLRTVETVEYWHVELDTHDVLLAEGAPAESFIDDDSRAMFHNSDDYTARYPDAHAAAALYCAPRVKQGSALEAIRTRLALRTQALRTGATLAA